MGLIDDKKNVFTTIGAYTSLREEYDLPDTTNVFTSINNKKDIVPFLLDTLKVVVGTTALEQLTGELFTTFADKIEPTLKDAVKKQVTQYNAGEPLSSTNFGAGVSVNVKDIDIFQKLHTSPGSEVGELLYDNVNPNFDSVAYNAITANGSDVPFNNLLVNYNSALDEFTFKPDLSTNPNPTIGEWFSEYIDNTTFINKKEFQTNILNGIFGSITANQNKTTESVFNELAVDKIINQVIEGDENFEISPDDYPALMQRANEAVAGIMTYDMGCGIIAAELPLSGLTDLISTISGSTDPNLVGNAINSTLGNSFTDTENEDVSEKNKETIRDGFFARLIKILTNELAKLLTTSPQARMILALSSSFENNGIPQIGDPKEDLKNFKVYINCVIKDAMALLNEFIFGLIIGFLIALLDPIVRKVIREKINQYLGVIKSLISSKL